MESAERAVVLGGGMAGLLSARVLAEFFDQVTLVDRDDLAAAPGDRRGVPQARHIHAVLPGGQQALEELFAGLTSELAQQGAPAGDMLADTRLYFGGHRMRRARSGLTMLSLTRPFLESQIRDRVLALPNVTVAGPCDIVGLVATPDGRRVSGVTVFGRADGSAAEVLPADLVVDATGRASRTPQWLPAMGYGPPAEERVEIDLGYATSMYRLPAAALDGDLGCLIAPTPDVPRGGAMARVEGNRWIVTLTRVGGRPPPTEPAGFVAFAGSLPVPDIHVAIRDAEPVAGPSTYRFPANRWRRYDLLPRLPTGLLVLGDAVCCLNPVYGQGMTVAAQEALALRGALGDGRAPDAHRFFREIARIVASPWGIATGGDLSFAHATGRRSRKLRLIGRYLATLQAGAAVDAGLAVSFLRVSSLVDPPTALLRPRTAVRVVRYSRKHPDEREKGHAAPERGVASQVLQGRREQ
jgi:2-polyprenyl-6-methoxyphenol hydroxylase-like FAD-dependent oxidoreductase